MRRIPAGVVATTALGGVVGLRLLWVAITLATAADLGFDSFLHSARSASYATTSLIVNANPPVSFLLYGPLLFLARNHALLLMTTLSTAALLSLAVLLRRQARASALTLLWLAAIDPVWCCLYDGQPYAVLALLAAGAWFTVEKRPLLAGALLGCVIAVKPNFALVAVAVAIAGYPLVGVVAGAVAGAASLVPVFVFGPGVYRRWLASSGPLVRLVRDCPHMAALGHIPAQFGAPWLSTPLTAAMVAGALAFVWSRRPDPRSALAAGLALSMAAGPICWTGYALLLFPFISTRMQSGPVRAAVLLLLIPGTLLDRLGAPAYLPTLASMSGARLVILTMNAAGHFVVGSLYSIAFLFMLAEALTAVQESRHVDLHPERHVGIAPRRPQVGAIPCQAVDP